MKDSIKKNSIILIREGVIHTSQSEGEVVLVLNF